MRLFLVLFTCVLLVSASSFTSTPPTNGKPAAALVELFVSESCDKSPLAEKIIERLQRENPDIAFVHYHIDYWDYSGWKDAYSNEQFSIYQRRYASTLGGDMQTPTAVVNGKVYFLATNEERIRQEIQRSKTNKASLPLAITTATLSGNQLALDYTSGALDEHEVHAVLTQNEAVRTIEGGDNKGKKIKQNNVVRAAQVTNAASGTFVFTLPTDFDLAQGKAVVFVQHKTTGIVVAQAIYAEK